MTGTCLVRIVPDVVPLDQLVGPCPAGVVGCLLECRSFLNPLQIVFVGSWALRERLRESSKGLLSLLAAGAVEIVLPTLVESLGRELVTQEAGPLGHGADALGQALILG